MHSSHKNVILTFFKVLYMPRLFISDINSLDILHKVINAVECLSLVKILVTSPAGQVNVMPLAENPDT